MTHCKLCKSTEANQTGSHLLSAFMVTTMIGERNREVGHLLSKGSVLGYRENAGAKPIKQDYILCRGCEQRLSFLESYISSEFTRKIDEVAFSQNFPLTSPSSLIPFKSAIRVNSRAFTMLLYSILWRASVSEKSMFSRFTLAPEIEEDFRRMLDSLLPLYENFKVSAKPKEWTKMLDNNDSFRCYPFVLIKCEKIPTRDTSRNMLFVHERFFNPYQMLANEFVILLAPEPFRFQQDYFQIQQGFGTVEHLVNDCSQLKVGILRESQWDKVLKVPRDAFVQQQVRVIQEQQRNQFAADHGRFPTHVELAKLTEEFIQKHWGNANDSE
jgi:hypothetical protein